MLQRVLEIAKGFGDTAVVVKPGYEDELKGVDLSGVTVILNPHWRRGISTSVRLGLKHAKEGGYDSVVVFLGDMPFLREETVEEILRRSESSGASVLYPVYKGRKGFPTLIKREFFEKVESLSGDVGFRAIIESHPGSCEAGEVDDPGCVLDIDRPEDVLMLE